MELLQLLALQTIVIVWGLTLLVIFIKIISKIRL
jgi:hypothetical protein